MPATCPLVDDDNEMVVMMVMVMILLLLITFIRCLLHIWFFSDSYVLNLSSYDIISLSPQRKNANETNKGLHPWHFEKATKPGQNDDSWWWVW
jgi:hypothetical protein